MHNNPQTFYLSWLASLPLMGIAFLPVYAHADEDSGHAYFSRPDMPQRFERNVAAESVSDRAHFAGDDRSGFGGDRSADRDFRDNNAEIARRFDHRDADQVNIDGDNMTGFSDDQPSDWGLGYDSEGMATNDDDADFDGDNMMGFSDDRPSDWDSSYNTEFTAPRDDDGDHYHSYTFYLPDDD